MFLSVGVWHCVTVIVRDSLLQKRPPILSLSRARVRALTKSFQGTFFSAFSLHLLSVYSTPSRALPVVNQSVISLLRISAAVFIVSTCGSAFLF